MVEGYVSFGPDGTFLKFSDRGDVQALHAETGSLGKRSGSGTERSAYAPAFAFHLRALERGPGLQGFGQNGRGDRAVKPRLDTCAAGDAHKRSSSRLHQALRALRSNQLHLTSRRRIFFAGLCRETKQLSLRKTADLYEMKPSRMPLPGRLVDRGLDP